MAVCEIEKKREIDRQQAFRNGGDHLLSNDPHVHLVCDSIKNQFDLVCYLQSRKMKWRGTAPRLHFLRMRRSVFFCESKISQTQSDKLCIVTEKFNGSSTIGGQRPARSIDSAFFKKSRRTPEDDSTRNTQTRTAANTLTIL